ncbi:hypothetical protein LX69_01868 [Breznakibacter xylanolyticus]|uniref:Uncharacterized protein n=2 Tax=Breznakibacter xylanolyticus TaxID=990 RepID=A0A2W7NI74_9BACT|nr:hypothetical protein LX69_01868 [Breznakibacter xylanolyticus]
MFNFATQIIKQKQTTYTHKMETTCKNYEKCPIYNGILKDKATTASNYRRKYCDAGHEGWNSCKRYLVKEKTGFCPPDILPNTFRSIDEIIHEMEMMQKLS